MGLKKPGEIAEIVSCSVGVSKCELKIPKMLILAFFAGVYIGFGAILATTVTQDLAAYVGTGLSQFMGGAVFSVGLMLVVICGAELFTGNNLIVMSGLEKDATWPKIGINLVLVYVGNLIGSLVLVYIYFATGLWKMNAGALGARAVAIANAKVNLDAVQALTRGILCNWLVCLAVWLTISSEDVIGKIFGCFFPIMAFVASGFEHSVANMYFIPIGVLLGGTADYAASATANLTWLGCIANLFWVTIGNVIGGVFFVGILYWFVYRKD